MQSIKSLINFNNDRVFISLKQLKKLKCLEGKKLNIYNLLRKNMDP